MKKLAAIIALASQMGYSTDSFGVDANTLVSTTKAVAHAKSLSLIDALAKSEQELYEKTDLDRFITTARKQKKQKKNVPPAKPSKAPAPAPADDDDDDGDDDDDDENNVQTAQEETEEISQKGLPGRDKFGHFKNHQAYLQLKNKINEHEKQHMKIFNEINAQLKDKESIIQVIDMQTADDGLVDTP